MLHLQAQSRQLIEHQMSVCLKAAFSLLPVSGRHRSLMSRAVFIHLPWMCYIAMPHRLLLFTPFQGTF